MLEHIMEIIREAGLLMENNYTNVEEKDSSSNCVTDMDINVQEFLTEIDGTSNFIRRRLGSAALELAYLVAGKVKLYFEIRIFAWDVAAAAAIIKEAGGYIEFLFHDKLPIPGPLGVIAANSKENLEKLKEAVYSELTSQPY